VVETIDYEVILAAMLADLQARDSAFDALVESDPAFKILEVCAYRETLLRQRVNDAAKAIMLAYATGADLDNLVALFGVERLDGESDSALRLRGHIALEGYSTAGPIGSYTFHALSASAEVKDVDIFSPEPGEVVVTVLSTVDDGTPSPELLTLVDATLNDETIRPLTDFVTVQAATLVEFTVDAELYLYGGPDAETVRDEAETRLLAYVEDHHRLGHDITLSGLFAALHVEGAVQRVELSLPVATLVVDHDEAAYCTAVNVVVAGEDE
jgi:phage-related baseplate assembly protein